MTAVRVGSVKELWIGEMRGCLVQGQKILLIRLDDGVHAFEDRCAHLGVPLSTGTLDANVLTCRAHHYQYDARTGAGINPYSACLAKYPVTVADGEIFVDLERPSRPAPRRGRP